MLNHSDPDQRTLGRAETVSRRHRWIGALVLLLAIIGSGWSAKPPVPRSKAVELALASQQKDPWDLRDQITKMGERIEARMDGARKQAQESSAQMLRRLHAEMQAVRSRLGHLESSREGDQARVAELQRELVQMRTEMAKQADELSAVRRQSWALFQTSVTMVEESGIANERRLASLKESEERNRRDMEGMQNRLAVERIDFEVVKNHSRELDSGISFGVTGTDVRHRRVNGWMWVMPDRNTIWLRDQAEQQPVVFYDSKDGRKRELVITNVMKNSVTGYLLVPKGAGNEPASDWPSE